MNLKLFRFALAFLLWFLTVNCEASETKYNDNKSSDLEAKHGNQSSLGNIRIKRQDIPVGDFELYPINNQQVMMPGNDIATPSIGAGVVGTGLALKAVKKGLGVLTLLKIPIGLAVLGGIVALVSGALPPVGIGGVGFPITAGATLGRKRRETAIGGLGPEQLQKVASFFATLPEDPLFAQLINASRIDRNRCLQRLACEASKPGLGNTEEARFVNTFLEPVLKNRYVNTTLKKDIIRARKSGKSEKSCTNFLCTL